MKNQTNNISFDFDGTLSVFEVEQIALSLKNRGYNIWITTVRYPDDYQGSLYTGQKIDNSKVYEVSNRIGIPKEQINFLSFDPKRKFFIENPNFIFHLDDNFFKEVVDMNESEECLVPAVWYHPNLTDWKDKINAYL